MLYSIVYYPPLDDRLISDFRNEYDPYAGLCAEHIAIVYPVPDSIGRDAFDEHVESVIESWRPFGIRLNGLEKSWDHWMLLTLREGREEMIQLHHTLYTGPLASFLRSDIEYIPHLGLGHFGLGEYDPLNPEALELDRVAYNSALEKAMSLDLDYRCTVDMLTLVEIADDLSELRDIGQISL